MSQTFNVGTEAELNAAINTVNAAGSGNAFIINLTASISLSSALSISPAVGSTVTLDGANFGLTDAYGLDVNSGEVTLQNIALHQTYAYLGFSGSSYETASLSLRNTQFDGFINGFVPNALHVLVEYIHNGSMTIDAAGVTSPNSLYIEFSGTGSGPHPYVPAVNLVGGTGDDTFYDAMDPMTSADRISGGGGSDKLMLALPGVHDVGGVTGISSYEINPYLQNPSGTFQLLLSDGNFTGLSGNVITVLDDHTGAVIDASAVSAGHSLRFIGANGSDTIKGGAGDDWFVFQFAPLISSDAITGGGGHDLLLLTIPGKQDASGVSGVAFFQIGTGGPYSISLSNANFGSLGQIGLSAGVADTTVDGSALSAAHSLFLIGGSGADHFTGGAGADVFQFTTANLSSADTAFGGSGQNELLMADAGTVAASGVSNVRFYQLADGGANSLKLTDANFATRSLLGVNGGSGGNTIDGSTVSGSHSLWLIGGAGADTLKGGGGADVFQFTAGNLTAADTVIGGGGRDELLVTTPGALDASGVGGVTFYQLANGGANSLTLTDANFTGVTTGNLIGVGGGDSGNTIDGSALSAGNWMFLIGGAGPDNFKGGAGQDAFSFTASDLTAADRVTGGGGYNNLLVTTPGAPDVSGVSGVRFYQLANGGANSLTLTDANLVGVAGNLLGVGGGDSGNTIDGSAVSAAHALYLRGGAGADIVLAGSGTNTLIGGGGSDKFVFSDITAASLITDFAGSSDAVALRNSGFDLGFDNGKGTTAYQPLDASVFSTAVDGSFTTTGQRISYDQTGGRLLYAASGSATPAGSVETVATLSGAPSLGLANLLFTQ